MCLSCLQLSYRFKLKVPYISGKLIDPANWFLYKHVWPLGLRKNTLAIIGHIRVAGSFPPAAELQARWAVQVFKVS